MVVPYWKFNIKIDPVTYAKLLQKKAKMEQDLRMITRNPKSKISMPKMMFYVVRNGWDINHEDLKKIGKFRWD